MAKNRQHWQKRLQIARTLIKNTKNWWYREMIGMFNISAISLYLYLSFLPNYQFLTAKPSFFLLGYLQSIGYVPKL